MVRCVLSAAALHFESAEERIMSTRRAFFGALSALASSAATARAQDRASLPITPMVLPPAELKLLRRVTNGVTPEDTAAINGYGYDGYIDWQLNPSAIDDSACETRLA